MPELALKREARPQGVCYRVEGAFSGHDARALARALAAETAPVELDFSRADPHLELGLAALAAELRAGDGLWIGEGRAFKVVLRGLGFHHRRLLRYLGIAIDDGPVVWREDAPSDDARADLRRAQA